MIRPPSGEQFELRSGDQRAVVVEVGGALREYQVGARHLLDGFALEETADGARGALLVPWPNRIRDGRYDWEGEAHQLDVTEVAHGNAIHGLARWHNWRLMDRAADRVALGLRLHPMPGYPFLLDLEVEYRLSDAGLEVTTRAENIGTRPCPYGAGFHPYLTVGGLLDDAVLRVPATRRLIADAHGIPTSSEAVAGGRHDFRGARAIGGLALDDCFCDLARESDGRARVTLANERHGVTLWLGEAYPYVMIYSGDTLAPRRRRRGIAVEPMTCAPNAFVTGAGLVRLEPNGVHVATWGIEP